MQMLKEELRSDILKYSKKEFMSCGFNNASLRNIALNSSTTVSNLYNYFKNKEEIFTAIVKPAVDYIGSILEKSAAKEFHEFDSPIYMKWHIEFINMIYYFINNYRDELVLLFSKSAGSVYEDFKDRTAKFYVMNANCTAFTEKPVSDFFMYNFTLFYLNYLEKLSLEAADDEKIKKHLTELTVYSHGGFNALIDNEDAVYNEIINSIGNSAYLKASD